MVDELELPSARRRREYREKMNTAQRRHHRHHHRSKHQKPALSPEERSNAIYQGAKSFVNNYGVEIDEYPGLASLSPSSHLSYDAINPADLRTRSSCASPKSVMSGKVLEVFDGSFKIDSYTPGARPLSPQEYGNFHGGEYAIDDPSVPTLSPSETEEVLVVPVITARQDLSPKRPQMHAFVQGTPRVPAMHTHRDGAKTARPETAKPLEPGSQPPTPLQTARPATRRKKTPLQKVGSLFSNVVSDVMVQLF
ncbi:hypothetical protein J8273_1852 [Carpediemonas membranifera]|uniref:Uncharacterized protein n=1 Tax=Carpediemonas membranifera TaxID=201153 RepID=A0A8J6BAR0_9EUKA|nr:hypothetical protein J8273_1852 [Carpediemonas membranifera]|eukprot:KAG9396809.1 hypothetical protein J8273_1852 [Carpediemonas membranifera]